METYPPNATAVERLQWYRDYDVEGGYILATVLDLLEECFSIDVGFEP